MNDDAGSDGPGSDGYRPATKLVEAGRRKEWTRGIVNPPVWRASTMLFDDCAHLKAASKNPNAGLYYGRRGAPTQWSLAEALTELEPGAAGTILYPSGTAAIAQTLLALLKPGDELLMVDSSYEPTRVFCATILKRMGIATQFYDPLADAGAIAALCTERTKLIFLESPGSLTFEVQDVPGIAAMARGRGIATVLDNTWATPLLFPAIAHVDVSILACTKYVVGHSDVMLGSATARPGPFERVRTTAQRLGNCVSPDDAFLAARGLRTMGVRLKQHEAGALAVARWLEARPEVARVIHPAIEGCPGHDLWKRDFLGASGLFAFELARADEAARARLIDSLSLFGIGFSWGGFESLALPIDPAPIRETRTWPTGALVRIHIGIEDPADLIADLDQAFARL
ncbi:cystathionine beta-lyase [Sphingomonas bacterium]|uniref:cystathionine beta-lyase n=1 Tax=Sphingomonas bacterium TaxID=1895847 RepID=UPI0020C5FF5B|nr:cystathionine beta-lyase [Sphingomonas bacterium]